MIKNRGKTTTFKLKTKENTTSLENRITSYQQYATKDITPWIIELMDVRQGEDILDIGCGTGLQSIQYAKSGATIIGADISDELLTSAKKNAEGIENIDFVNWDMNKYPIWGKETFDRISSCFSLYYAENIESTITGLKYILKPDGLFLVVAPTENNSLDFMWMHWNVNRIEPDIMALKRTCRTRDEIIPALRKQFNQVDIHIFKNELVYYNVEDFMKYYLATPLFRDSGVVLEEHESNVRKQVMRIINTLGYYKILKESYGIIASNRRVKK